MSANHIPVNAAGNGSIFKLLAERLSSTPARQGTRPSRVAAPRFASPVTRLMAEAAARDTFVVRRPLYTRYAPGLPGPEGRAIARSAMWSRIGFVGASLLAAGLVLNGDGAASAPTVLALVAGGGALATYAWRRAWLVLDGIDPASARNAEATAPEGVRQASQQ
jgi:hypothetical protein